MGYQRRLGSETTLVLINYGSTGAQLSVPGLSPGATLSPRYGTSTGVVINATGQAAVSMPGLSVQVYAVVP